MSRGVDHNPSFGSPALRLAVLTRGFASPSRDGFALIEKGSSLCDDPFLHGKCQAGSIRIRAS